MKIGIVGVSGYGGSELLRLCAGHPSFEITYVGGESTAGQSLAQRFPALADHPAGKLIIEPFIPERMGGVDLLFVSLPTGKSREPLAKVPRETRIVDVGGDHRFVEGWTYGLTELPGQRERIRGASRLANPGCYPAAALLALAPLLKEGLIEPEGIVIDAKSGVTGTGRGGASEFGYAETNEDLFAYGLEAHPHRRRLPLHAPVRGREDQHPPRPRRRGLDLLTCFAAACLFYRRAKRSRVIQNFS